MGTMKMYKYGGMQKGYRFLKCPMCSKRGVSVRVWRSQHWVISRKFCKYCGYLGK